MSRVTVRPAKKSDGPVVLSLVDALADYEKLARPSRAAKARLLKDAFGARKRIDILLAEFGGEAVGYAIILETYSSFLALPTLYLEDLFVRPESRKMGAGLKLFQRCLKDARRRGCGRMDWTVLDWNKLAIGFYKKLGAEHLKPWHLYRIQIRK